MKILITGGHLTPALAVIEEIGKQAGIVFVGRKYIENNKNSQTLEYEEISKKNIPFYHLHTGRITRILNFNLLLNLLKIPYGFYQTFLILSREKPDLILSFGGYIGFPLCIVGKIMKIPVFIHEQTAKPGLANRISGKIAEKIFLSFPDTKMYFPSQKTLISGNPLRKSILKVDKKPFNLPKNRPVIYITGGSLGSHSINLKIKEILIQLLTRFTVIHQTGKNAEYRDFERFKEMKIKMHPRLQENYYLNENFYSEELGYIYSQTDLLIGRSGANTVFELIAWKIPSILIPLPWSANQEQLKHAQILNKAGVSEIFDQSENTNNLTELIEKILADKENYVKNFKNVELYKENAAEIIVQTIFSEKTFQN